VKDTASGGAYQRGVNDVCHGVSGYRRKPAIEEFKVSTNNNLGPEYGRFAGGSEAINLSTRPGLQTHNRFGIIRVHSQIKSAGNANDSSREKK